MLNCQIISFSPSLFYTNTNFPSLRLLSVLLFDIYFSELDNYILNLIYKLNLKYNSIFKLKSKAHDIIKCINCLNLLFPLKFNKKIKFPSKSFSLYETKLFQKNKPPIFTLKSFERKIEYVRFMNYFLIGLIGSKLFVLRVKSKIVSFINGNLHLKIIYCNSFAFFESQNFFLGYQIRCAFLNFDLFYFVNLDRVKTF